MKLMMTFLILNIICAVINLYVGNSVIGFANTIAACIIGYMVYDLRKDIKDRRRTIEKVYSLYEKNDLIILNSKNMES